ncbi:cupin domain-containing protein, partial [candidate division GN15 bacterium]|nr:cupin domain-containing protein [candidate division GN15 bacterium]
MPFFDPSSLEQSEPVPGFKGRFIHSSYMTMAYWEITAGSSLPEHSHPHEQVANVIEGEFELTVNGETKVCKAGDVAVIPGDVSHSGTAIT